VGNFHLDFNFVQKTSLRRVLHAEYLSHMKYGGCHIFNRQLFCL